MGALLRPLKFLPVKSGPSGRFSSLMSHAMSTSAGTSKGARHVGQSTTPAAPLQSPQYCWPHSKHWRPWPSSFTMQIGHAWGFAGSSVAPSAWQPTTTSGRQRSCRTPWEEPGRASGKGADIVEIVRPRSR